MRPVSKLLRRLMIAGLAAGAALCVTLGIAFWKVAGPARPRRPNTVAAFLDPPRVDFWERIDLLLFRGRAATAGGAAGARAAAPVPGLVPGGAASRGELSRAAAGGAAAPGAEAAAGAAPAPGAEAPAAAAAAARDPYRRTADADQRDLAAALIPLGQPEERRRSLLDQYRRLREALLSQDEAAGAERSAGIVAEPGPPGAVVPAAPRRAAGGELAVPEGLPVEFAAYLEGALAYRRGDLAAARDHWQRLLALPEAARHYRSTWAAFMLGRVALRQQPPAPAAAARWFRQTRELAARGFADSLGLAVLSLGWEARAEVARQRFERAEALYAQQVRAGDATAIDSFTIFWRQRLIHAVLGQ